MLEMEIEPPASPPSTPLKQNYEVFLSFRTEDTDYGFTDHLYHGLKKKGIKVFRDNEKLHVVEMISQLFEAIKASKILILIISSGYASSIWCLRELFITLECNNMSGQFVLPIFYHVKPSDVREQKGDFGKNFQLCKKKHNLEGKFVQDLENALTKVATMKGWEVNETKNGYERELVDKIVARIFNELEIAVPVVSNFLVGVEQHVKEIMKMIDTKPNDAKIIAILGMGGVGKTTLAKVLYNTLCSDFECCSFVSDIREASKIKGIEALQNQIISDILVDKLQRGISDVEEGITIIKERFEGKVLLLLDDIEDKDQLNKLVSKNSWVGSKSIIIITSRYADVAFGSAVNLCYKLNELDMNQSFELFCKHAFVKDASCPRNLESLAWDITSMTGGLPLAIKVIGSLLFQRDEDFWEEAWERLRRVTKKAVRDKLKEHYEYEEQQDKLKEHYDRLEYEEQQIFLDIACFSFENELEYASYMWKSCGFYPKKRIERLISLSLIKWDGRFNTIAMHDQLRDLAREIVRREGGVDIGLCSRIWLEEMAIEVMERKQGTDNVQGLILQRTLEEELHYGSEHFERMRNLRFLRMGNVHLTGDFENCFPNLRWLHWGSGYVALHHNNIMEINFNPKKLVVLELFSSNITEHWKGWSHTKGLKVIKLERCMNLTTTPDFSSLEELEVLILIGCRRLKMIHPSIGKLSKTLKVLKVASCRNLQELPIELGKMEELRELDISHTGIREIPPIFKGYMTKLQRLNLEWCISVTKIPESIGNLTSLIMLDLSDSGVKELPNSIGELCNLESLQMDSIPIKCLPTSIGMLSKLRELDLMRFKELKSLPNLPSSLMSLSFNGNSMETLPCLSNLTKLKYLKYMDFFQRRNKALNLGDLNQLETLEIGNENFESIAEEFEISDPAEELDMAPENFSLQLELPVSLQELEVYGCQTIRTLPNFSKFKNLAELSLNGCSELMEINGLGGAESLTALRIRGCRKLSRLDDLSHLERLSDIELSDCEKLSDVQGIEKLKSLTYLIFSRCHPEIKFLDLSMLTNLQSLTIEDKELMEISGLHELKFLKYLFIFRCKSLQHLSDLSKCRKLKRLVVEGCEKLTTIQGLENLTLLENLNIRACFALSNLPTLPNVMIESNPPKEEVQQW